MFHEFKAATQAKVAKVRLRGGKKMGIEWAGGWRLVDIGVTLRNVVIE